MGYHTDFEGKFSVNPPLKPEHIAYLKAFNKSRRMNRNEFVAVKFEDPVRKAVDLPVGANGEYYVGSARDGNWGQNNDASVVDYNNPPPTQPGLWCKWTPKDDGTAIKWDGGEKFYDYVEWLEYLLVNFLMPWGYLVNGKVQWFGEDRTDFGTIVVEDNIVTTKNEVTVAR